MKSDRNLKYLIWNGTALTVADTFTSGIVIVAFASLFGADSIYLGFLMAIPFFSYLMNFFAGYLLEKGISSKKISIYSTFVSRPVYLILAILPFVCDAKNILKYLIICIILLFFVGNITSGAFSVWMKRIIPERFLGKFFAIRYRYMMCARLICYTGVYFLLKYINQCVNTIQIKAYSLLFLVAFIMAVSATITFFFMEEKESAVIGNKNFFEHLKLGLSNKNFLKLITFLGLLSFLNNFFFPFMAIYMLKCLKYTMDTIIVITIIFQLSYIFSSKYWGNLNDKRGIKYPVVLSSVICAVCVLGFLIISWGPIESNIFLFISICILHIFAGIANASFQLTLNNAPYVYIPDKDSNTFIPAINALKSTVAGLATVFAGVFVTYSSIIEKQLHIANRDGWFLFFLFSLILIFCVALNLKKVQKADDD